MEFFTLRELGAQVGDVVGWNGLLGVYNYTITHIDGDKYFNTLRVAFSGNIPKWTIIARATPPAKLWRDMTDVEKGALLLAHHEGKVIEFKNPNDTLGWVQAGPIFASWCAYRVKPEHEVKTVALCWRQDVGSVKNKIGTVDLIGGKPCIDTIKIGEL